VYLHKTSQAGQWFRRSVAGRSSRRLGCAIRPVVCGIHGGQSGTGQVFLRELQLSAVSISPPVLHTHFSFLLSECLHTHFSFLLSECLHTHLVFCCQNVFTRTSVFCCQYVSTIALHALFFYCQYVSTSSPHALQFSAVIMSPLAFQFSAASMSPPMPKGGNSLSLTLHIQVTLAVDSIVK